MDAKNYRADSSNDLISKQRRIRQFQTRRATFKWIVIVFVAAIIVIVLIKVVPPLIKQLDIIDNTYRPRDVERQYHQIQKLRDPRGGDPTKGGGS
jgi:hypothetical protein